MWLNWMLESTGSEEQKSKEPLCYQMISGSGYDWFYDPVGRSMVEVPRGTEIVKISNDIDHRGRVLVRAPHKFLLISEEEVVDLGFN